MLEYILLLICLPLIYLGIGYFFTAIGYIFDFFLKKSEVGCVTIGILIMFILTILGGISMLKSCAENDRGSSDDYYDAPI